MVHRVVRYQSRRLVVVLSTGVQVAVEARKVRARDLDADAMADVEVVARRHRLERDLVRLPGLHEYLLVVTIPVAQSLDRLVEVVGSTIGVDVDELDGDVGVLAIGGDVHDDLDWTAHFQPLGERLGRVDENVRAILELLLIHRAAGECIRLTAHVAAE
jgi:hypothetical protein